MAENERETTADRESLPPTAITERFESLEVGDEITFNNRDRPHEVVETDTYSVTVTDPDGNRITLSQNLQTGGWNVHEEIWWVSSERTDE
ncbi:transcriptional regulator [Natronolimnohabitans sp. A-GB9]|uniref:transcriptional regulator n=1 Tax=Natronolimnohabitans sp. A-GB9 TaxID=3069757 RepID=UPI0027B6E38C|nr:transcriptional regulator [Natronolimnohabitans sp. A-GB9]MDQ2052241.1 transcriptional regulator [Natronolimnohabitans sp. A-GB9]